MNHANQRPIPSAYEARNRRKTRFGAIHTVNPAGTKWLKKWCRAKYGKAVQRQMSVPMLRMTHELLGGQSA